MNYSRLHIPVKRLARAAKIRAQAWEDIQTLIDRGRLGDAWQRMRNACQTAWEIETLQRH